MKPGLIQLLLANEEFFEDNLQSVLMLSAVDSIFPVVSFDSVLQLILCQEKISHIRMPFFYENWIQFYLSYDFFLHFRMTKDNVQRLVNKIGRRMQERKYRGGFPVIPLEKELLIALWYLAKGDTLVSISDRFNCAVSKVYYILSRMIEVLTSLRFEYIKWPTQNECIQIAEEFKARSNFPDVVGAIDGCHISCKVPKVQHDSYQDRKFNHSITLQGICTANRLLTNISVGCPGSVHDSRVLKESSLYKAIERNDHSNFFYGKYHLLGDSAYPLKEWLLTPYRDYGNLTRLQKNYNYAHSATRVVIENVFGMLKGRWRILQFVNVYSIRRAIDIICACCVLHNFCLLHFDDYSEEVVPSPNNENDQQYIGRGDREVQAKRDAIANSLI